MNDVAPFWCNVMMTYLTCMTTECQTAQAAQIWFQNVHFNLLKKLGDEIRVFIVLSLKYNVLQKRTVRASMPICDSRNYRRVIVRIFTLRPMEI